MIEFNKAEITILEKVKDISKKYNIRFEINSYSIKYKQNGNFYNVKNRKRQIKYRRAIKGTNIIPVDVDNKEISENDEIDFSMDIDEDETNREINTEIDKNKEISKLDETDDDDGNSLNFDDKQASEVGDGINASKFDDEINIENDKNKETSKLDDDKQPNKVEIDIDEISNVKLIKFKRELLTVREPIYLVLNRDVISEESYEDLFCNLVKREMDFNKRNYMLLYQFYRIGYFLFNIIKRFNSISRSLATAIIKGCGIANLFCTSERKYCNRTRKKSVKLYNSALRIYKIYDCFPNPKHQIARTASKVYVRNFLDIGNNDEFIKFTLQISKEIDTCRSNYEIPDEKFNAEKKFLRELITDELIIDIKNYYKFTDFPLKIMDNVNSLGLVRTESFFSLFEARKIDNVSNFLSK